MRRKRPLLYDVLGDDGKRRRRRAARKEDGGGPVRSGSSKVREIRLSQEFGAVVVAIAVVFVALSYYLGTLHGDDSESSGRLALTGPTPGGQGSTGDGRTRVPESFGRPRTEPERIWAIQACTIKWTKPSEEASVRRRGEALVLELRKRGYPHVRGRIDTRVRELRIHVGRAEESTVALRAMLEKIRHEEYQGRRDFRTAFIILVKNR